MACVGGLHRSSGGTFYKQALLAKTEPRKADEIREVLGPAELRFETDLGPTDEPAARRVLAMPRHNGVDNGRFDVLHEEASGRMAKERKRFGRGRLAGSKAAKSVGELVLQLSNPRVRRGITTHQAQVTSQRLEWRLGDIP